MTPVSLNRACRLVGTAGKGRKFPELAAWNENSRSLIKPVNVGVVISTGISPTPRCRSFLAILSTNLRVVAPLASTFYALVFSNFAAFCRSFV